MAFLQHRLEKVAAFGAVAKESADLSLWQYVTADAIATVAAANYFDTMVKKGVKAGDMIRCACSDGEQLLVVATNTGTHITTKKTGSAKGQAVTASASDTIATGLTTAKGVIVTIQDDPVAGVTVATATIGDQAGTPAAGAFLLKTWKHTDATHPLLVAATTFGITVNWYAWGV